MGENSFEREVLDRLKTIEVKLDSYEKIKEQVYANQMQIIKIQENTDTQQKQIEELRDRNKWLARAVVGAVITAFIGFIFMYIKIGAGIA